MATSDAIAALNERFPDLGPAWPLLRRPDGTSTDQMFVRVPPARLPDVCRFLRDDPRTKFEQLCDLTCVDYLEFPDSGSASVKSGSASVKSGGASVKFGGASVKSDGSSEKSGGTSVKSGGASAKAGDASAKSGAAGCDVASEFGHAGAGPIHGGDRFGVTYSLLSLTHNHRLWLKVFVNDPDPAVPSVVGLWAGANWMEREVFDLFGITFTGHPDLRRILTPDDFTDHPLRKDYPLRGKGERERLPVVTRETA